MAATTERKLRNIYIITTIHCVAMFFWALASNLIPHDAAKANEDTMPGRGYVPFGLMSKYEGATMAYVAHITPAIFWVFCIPLQFHPKVRKNFPRFHRYLGRAFIGTSCLMMLGVWFIIYSKLTYEHYVNGGENDPNPWVIHTLPGTGISYQEVPLLVVSAAFLYTAGMAVGYARAKDFLKHKIWIIRHCSWGLWVMTQRFVLSLIVIPYFINVYGEDGEFSGTGRFHSFFWSAIAGIVLSVGTAEYAVWLIKQEAGAKNPAVEKTKPTKTETPEEPPKSTKRESAQDAGLYRYLFGSAVLLLCLRSSHGLTSYRRRCHLPERLSSRPAVAVSTVSATSNANAVAIPAAGIPRELEELTLFESFYCEPEESSLESRNRPGQKIERVSMDPPIFVLRNALTREECHHIRTVASEMETEMEQGKTVSDSEKTTNELPQPSQSQQQQQPRKHSRVGWLENDRPSIEAIARRAHGLFLNGMPFHATRGIEPLQVVHYHDVGGEYVNHHDGNGRLLTVLYYLNGVGATWFPLASMGDAGANSLEVNDLMEARRASQNKFPYQDGVLVTCRQHMDESDEIGPAGALIANVKEGDAVAFYNYRVDGSMNWKAFHSGLPVTKDDLFASIDLRGDENKKDRAGGKWIANHFYHFVPSHIPETPPL